MREMKNPWYIQIDRQTYDYEPLEPIVIGPFHEKRKAEKHIDSIDVDDWCFNEAKRQRYYVDDVVMTKTPEIPSYGVNEPVK